MDGWVDRNMDAWVDRMWMGPWIDGGIICTRAGICFALFYKVSPAINPVSISHCLL